MKSVCVFCASAMGARPEYAAATQALAEQIAARRMTLVYGGGNIGLMGALADAGIAAGGRVVGVIPQALVEKELAHAGLAEQHVVATMHERKALMADLSDGFIALPGGWGTLDELCEMMTWAQLGIHLKPVGVLNVAGYFDGFLMQLEHSEREGLIKPQYRRMLLVDTDPVALLERMASYRSPRLDKPSRKQTTPTP